MSTSRHRRIIEVLRASGGPLGVNTLTGRVNKENAREYSLNMISHDIKTLSQAGVVKITVENGQQVYSLSEADAILRAA